MRTPEVYAPAGLMAALAVLFVAAVKVAVFR